MVVRGRCPQVAETQAALIHPQNPPRATLPARGGLLSPVQTVVILAAIARIFVILAKTA